MLCPRTAATHAQSEVLLLLLKLAGIVAAMDDGEQHMGLENGSLLFNEFAHSAVFSEKCAVSADKGGTMTVEGRLAFVVQCVKDLVCEGTAGAGVRNGDFLEGAPIVVPLFLLQHASESTSYAKLVVGAVIWGLHSV